MSLIQNEDFVVFDAQTMTETTNSADQQNYHYRGMRLLLDVTAISGASPTLDVKLQWKERKTGKYTDLPGAAFSQKTATGQDELAVYPGIAETANETVSDILPRHWRAVATLGASTSTVTLTLAGSLIL